MEPLDVSSWRRAMDTSHGVADGVSTFPLIIVFSNDRCDHGSCNRLIAGHLQALNRQRSLNNMRARLGALLALPAVLAAAGLGAHPCRAAACAPLL